MSSACFESSLFVAARTCGGLIKESNIRTGKSRVAIFALFVALFGLFHCGQLTGLSSAIQTPASRSRTRSMPGAESRSCRFLCEVRNPGCERRVGNSRDLPQPRFHCVPFLKIITSFFSRKFASICVICAALFGLPNACQTHVRHLVRNRKNGLGKKRF